MELADDGQSDVALEVALVELVEDDDAGVFEERVAGEVAAEDAFGEEPEPCGRAALARETYAIADLAADGAAARPRDVLGGGSGGDATGLDDHDGAAAGEVRVEDGAGHSRRLAGARSGAQDEPVGSAERRHDVRKERIDRERRAHVLPAAASNG